MNWRARRDPDGKLFAEMIAARRGIKKSSGKDITMMLQGQHKYVTQGRWTSVCNDTYNSLTATCISDHFELETLLHNCEKSIGTTADVAVATENSESYFMCRSQCMEWNRYNYDAVA